MNNLFTKFIAGFLALQMVIFSPVSLFADELTVLHGSENNWETFNVGVGQSTTITVVDEHGAAMVDGRAIIHVLQDYASQIYGNLDINGIIAILNANGFDIGADANVNVVGGLILSTLGISEQDFFSGMAALNQASNDPGFIHNAGHINVDPGSFLALIAGAIKNTGTIASEGGTAILAAGKEGYLSVGGDGLVNVQITKEVDAEVYDFQGNKIADQIGNSGTITANGGFVKLTAKGAEEVFDNIINHTGLIEAKSVSMQNGKIILEGGDKGIVRVNGTLDASGKDAGETGGKIHITGEKIGLFENAKIDVSGNAGGGEVLVGGDYQGRNEAIQNALAVYVDEDAVIDASAIQNGNGGKVIVWGTDSARAYGEISAKGGSESGNGGFIETSSHYLDVAGIRVSTAAPYGRSGQWLLDPYNVTISTDAGVAVTSPFVPNADSNINVSDLLAALDNSDVTITTGIGGASAGNISVLNAINSLSSNSLTLDAAGNVAINAAVTLGGSLALIAGNGISISAAIDIDGNFTGTSSAGITLSNNITADAGISFSDAVILGANVMLDSSGGDGDLYFSGSINGAHELFVDTSGGDIFVGGVIGGTTALSSLHLGGWEITVSDIGDGDTVGVSGTTTLSGENLHLTGTTYKTNAAGYAGAYDIFLEAGATTTFTTSDDTFETEQGTYQLADGSNLVINTNGGAIILQNIFGTSGEDVTLTSTGGTANTVSVGAIGNADEIGEINAVTITGSNGITLNGSITTDNGNILLNNNVNLAGDVAMTTGAGGAGDITILGTLNGAHTLDLTAGTGNIAFNTGIGNTTALTGLTVNSAAAVSFNNAATNIAGDADITAVNVNINQAFNTTSGGSLTVTNSGTLYVDANGDMNLAGAFNQNGAGPVNLGGDIQTEGALTLTGDVVLSNSVTLDTETGNNSAAGAVTITGAVSGNAAGRDLTINTASTSSIGGAVSLNAFSNAGGNYVNNVAVTTTGSSAANTGALTLNGNISLDDDGAAGASGFTLTGSGNVIISDNVTIDTEQGNTNGVAGGAVNFGSSAVSADANGYTFTINAGNSDAGETGGGITTGTVDNTGGNYLSSLTLNSHAATDGIIASQGYITVANGLTINGDLNTAVIGFNAGGDVSLTDSTALVLDASSVGGNFSLTLGQGMIMVGGATSVAGTTTITDNNAGETDLISLSHGNFTGAVNVTAAHSNVYIINDKALVLGASTIGGTLSATLSGAGSITQTGALNVTGTTTLAAGSGNNITLTNASNNFSTAVITSGNNVSLTDSNTLVLGASTVSGDLSVITGAGGNVNGALTQSGALSVDGTASFTNSSTSATAGNKNITLNNAANDFDTVTAAAGNNITLTDADDLTLGAITADDALTVTTVERLLLTGDITADTLSMTATGTTSGSGYIQQTAGTVTANTSSFEAYGARVVSNPPYPDSYLGIDLLENYDSSNQFGTLSMISNYSGASAQANGIGNTTVSGSANNGLFNVQIKNGNLTAGADDINCGSGNLNLSINGTGNIAVNGDLASAGSINISANGGTITQQTGTTIDGVVSMTNASMATLDNTGSLELGEINVTNLSVTASENITQNNAITTAGTVTLTAGGDFNQSADGSIVTGSGSDWGDVTIHAGTGTAATGAVTLDGTIEGNAILIDTGEDSTGDITQSGSLISHDTGTTGIAITNYGTGDIVHTSAGSMILTFADAPVTDLGISLIAAHGNIQQSGSIDAKQSLVTLNAENGDSITQDDGVGHLGSITSGRTVLIGQNGDDINLAGNNSLGRLEVQNGGTVNVNDVNASGLVLDTINADGYLTVTARSLSQSVSGDGIVMSGSGKSANFIAATGAAVTLDNDGNDFGGNTVNLAGADNTSAGAVTIVDDNASSLVLGTISSSGTTTITAKSITLSDDFNAGTSTVNLTATDTNITTGNNAINFSGGTLTSGDLNLTTASGRIYEDLGLIHSSGTMTIDASDGNNDGGNVVEFTSNLANLFGTVNITDAGDVVLYARDGYIISGISSTGDIAAKANYGFDDDTTGFLEVSGAITTSKTGGTILLSNARTTAEYGVIVNESGSLSASGNITLSAGSSEDGLTGNGISVAGSIHSDDGNIYIFNNRNYDVAPDTHYASNMNISGSISTDTGSVYLEDFGAGTITIADGANLDGGSNSDLTIQSDNGSINQTGGTLSGDTGINLIAAGAVNINSAGNITNGGVPIHITAGADSSLIAGGYLATLAVPLNVDITGVLRVTAGGQIGGNSAVMIGNATNVIVAGTPPGFILFNGIDITPKPVTATTTTNEAVSQTVVSWEINNAMPDESNNNSKNKAAVDFDGANLEGADLSGAIDTSGLDDFDGANLD